MAESPPELQHEIEKLESKHTQHPEGRFFVPLANAYRKVGEVDHAEALLREGLRQHPDYLSAHIVLGRCLADRGAMEEASEEFRFVLTLDPQNLIALRTLGELSVSAGRTAEAVGWYEQLLSVDPMNEEARRALDSLPGAQAEDLDAEFRPGGGWWEAPDDDTDPPVAEDVGSGGLLDVGDDLPILRGAETEPALQPLRDPQPRTEALDRNAIELTGAMFDDEEASLDAPGTGATSEVVTETIAELYARQGLHDRAAGVYRELVRRRGGDSALEKRLAELEGLASGPPAPTPEAATPAPAGVGQQQPETTGMDVPPLEGLYEAPADGYVAGSSGGSGDLVLGDDEWLPSLGAHEEERLEPGFPDDPFAGSFAGGFGGGAEDASASAADAAVGAIAAAPPRAAGPTISEYLDGLVGWRREAQAPSPQLDASVPQMAEAGTWAEPSALQPELSEQEPQVAWNRIAEPERQPARPELGEPLPELMGDSPPAEDPFPWEAASSPDETTPETSSRDDLFSFDSFLGTAPNTQSPGAEPSTPEPLESQRAAPSDAEVPSVGATSAAADEEDDLESFQAWLRSLKR